MTGLLCGLAVLMALGMVSCGDDDSSYRSENCAFATDAFGATYELCCRLTCSADYDHNDYSEQCIEVTTCTAPSGNACVPAVARLFQYPTCF